MYIPIQAKHILHEIRFFFSFRFCPWHLEQLSINWSEVSDFILFFSTLIWLSSWSWSSSIDDDDHEDGTRLGMYALWTHIHNDSTIFTLILAMKLFWTTHTNMNQRGWTNHSGFYLFVLFGVCMLYFNYLFVSFAQCSSWFENNWDPAV